MGTRYVHFKGYHLSYSNFQRETSKKLFEKKRRHGGILGKNADKLGDGIDKMQWRHRDTIHFPQTVVALFIWLLSKFYIADRYISNAKKSRLPNVQKGVLIEQDVYLQWCSSIEK